MPSIDAIPASPRVGAGDPGPRSRLPHVLALRGLKPSIAPALEARPDFKTTARLGMATTLFSGPMKGDIHHVISTRPRARAIGRLKEEIDHTPIIRDRRQGRAPRKLATGDPRFPDCADGATNTRRRARRPWRPPTLYPATMCGMVPYFARHLRESDASAAWCV